MPPLRLLFLCLPAGFLTPLLRAEDPPLRLNQIQVIATHNSYRIRMEPALEKAIQAFSPAGALDGLDYSHRPFAEQFDRGHVRGLELDVYADPAGGLFSRRAGLALLQRPAEAGEPELLRPGSKILHIPDIDFRTQHLTFVSALQAVKAWSDAHPRHLPLFLNVETKEESIADKVALPGLTVPVPFDAAACDGLDAEVRAVFGQDAARVLTPAAVQGSHPTLEAAVKAGAWPEVDAVRGNVLFIMEGPGVAAYEAGHPSLTGRLMFTYSRPGRPEAAFLLMNDPGKSGAEIAARVREGYMVRTRADEGTRQARSGDTTRRDVALASGAHIVSTDYCLPDPRAGQTGWSDYQVALPDGAAGRANPVSAPPGAKVIE